jgi:hypothetical protein
MTTDVTLWSAKRTILIDAKYYKEALQSHYGSRTVHSANLYQLMAYLHGTESPVGLGHTNRGHAGVPAGAQTVDLRYKIDEYYIRVHTLNLGQAWTGVESDLLDLTRGCGERSTCLTESASFTERCPTLSRWTQFRSSLPFIWCSRLALCSRSRLHPFSSSCLRFRCNFSESGRRSTQGCRQFPQPRLRPDQQPRLCYQAIARGKGVYGE